MTSYTNEPIECPHCEAALEILLLTSCNTFGAEFYTDGFVDGPMYDETSRLQLCPSCGEYFWLEDATSECSESDSGAGQFRPRSGAVRGPQYEDALRRAVWKSRDQELYVRVRAWWSSNAPYRSQPAESFDLSAQEEANLTRLLDLLDDESPDALIMRAEIYRELGRFEDSLEALGRVSDDRYATAVQRVGALARAMTRTVAPIKPSENEHGQDGGTPR